MALSSNASSILKVPPSSISIVPSGWKPHSAVSNRTRASNFSGGFCSAANNLLQSVGRRRSSGVKMMCLGVPSVPFGPPGEKQWMDLWNALYRHRIIFISDYIEEENGNQLLATMLYLDALDDRKRLRLYINSPGGDLTPSLALYDTMKSLRSTVQTNCCGCAYNMAAFLLAAGQKGNRTATPLSSVTMEPPAGTASGRADDIRNEANELIRIRNYLHKEMAKMTGQPLEKIDQDLSRLIHFDAEEAVEYGIIDRIVRPSRLEDRPGST